MFRSARLFSLGAAISLLSPVLGVAQSLEAVANGLSSRIVEKIEETAEENPMVTLVGFDPDSSTAPGPSLNLVGPLRAALERHARFRRFGWRFDGAASVSEWESRIARVPPVLPGNERFFLFGRYSEGPHSEVEWNVTLVDRRGTISRWSAIFSPPVLGCPEVADPASFRTSLQFRELDALPGLLESVDAFLAEEWASGELIGAFQAAVGAEVEAQIARTGMVERWTLEYRGDRAREVALSMFETAMESPEVTTAFAALKSRLIARIEPGLHRALREIQRRKLTCASSLLFRQSDRGVADAFLLEAEPPRIQGSESGLDLAAGFAASPTLEERGLSEAISAWIGDEIKQQIAEAVARRILGKIGSRIIPVIGWIIALGEAKESAEGGFIRELGAQLLSYENFEIMRSGLFASSRQSVESHFEKAESKLRSDMLRSFNEFEAAVRPMLESARQSSGLRALLGRWNGYQVLHLMQIHGVADRLQLRRAILMNSLSDLVDLPEWQFGLALSMVRELKDPTEAVAWLKVAPRQFRRVVEQRIYSRVPVQELPSEIVGKLLTLNDVDSMGKLARLAREDHRLLLALSTAELEALGQAEEEFLEQAFSVASGLDASNLSPFVENILARPANLQFFASHQDRMVAFEQAEEREILDFTDPGKGFIFRVGALFGSHNPGLLTKYLLRRHPVAVTFTFLLVLGLGLGAVALLRKRPIGTRKGRGSLQRRLPA